MRPEPNMMTRRRRKRLCSFLIDMAVLFVIFLLGEQLFGVPKLLGTRQALKALNGMGGTQSEFEAAYAAFYELFEDTYMQSLLVWSIYEAASTVLTGGRTAGKLVTGLRLVAVKHRENRLLTAVKLVLRAAVKPLLLLLLRGWPFMISIIMIFADRTDRTGYDRLCGLAVELEGPKVGKEDRNGQ